MNDNKIRLQMIKDKSIFPGTPKFMKPIKSGIADRKKEFSKTIPVKAKQSKN